MSSQQAKGKPIVIEIEGGERIRAYCLNGRVWLGFSGHFDTRGILGWMKWQDFALEPDAAQQLSQEISRMANELKSSEEKRNDR